MILPYLLSQENVCSQTSVSTYKKNINHRCHITSSPPFGLVMFSLLNFASLFVLFSTAIPQNYTTFLLILIHTLLYILYINKTIYSNENSPLQWNLYLHYLLQYNSFNATTISHFNLNNVTAITINIYIYPLQIHTVIWVAVTPASFVYMISEMHLIHNHV